MIWIDRRFCHSASTLEAGGAFYLVCSTMAAARRGGDALARFGTANPVHVLLGTLACLAISAMPFAFKTVREREANVHVMREGKKLEKSCIVRTSTRILKNFFFLFKKQQLKLMRKTMPGMAGCAHLHRRTRDHDSKEVVFEAGTCFLGSWILLQRLHTSILSSSFS